MEKNQLSKKANLLHLSSLKLAERMRNGNFKSLYHGRGIEFSGVREYLPDDDVRSIDWNVTARMGKPFVKIFEEEHELDIFLVIDKSVSMSNGTGLQSRLEAAIECASLLTLASLHNNCPVGAVTFDGKINFFCEPKAGRNHAMLVLSKIEKEFDKKTNGSALNNALQGAEKILKKSSLIMILSDFRTTGWEKPFSHLCKKNDVIAVRIQDPLDEALPLVGSVPFVDPETHFHTTLPTFSSKFANAWKRDNDMRLHRWEEEVIRHGGIPLILNTSNEPASQLIKFFSIREKS